jgi:class 3 adenylate cyclase/plastocyanin
LDKIVVIPKGFRNLRIHKSSYVKYFTPRFIKMQIGQTNTWINRDSESHELVSGNAEHGRPDDILNTGIIESGKSFSKRFDISIPSSIPYFCIKHPEERGTIIIYNKYEDEMNMKERIDHIKQVFTFDNIKQQQEQQDIASTLSRYEDPVIREGYYHHELETIHNRILTIVFWDISGFSNLCNVLKNEPHLIVEFLQEYFTMANNIIHKHNGILDKFIGDGIMSYFGYKDSDDGTEGAFNSINAAFELQQSFEEIKSEWIEIWKKQFHHKVTTIDLKCGINTGETLIGKLSTIERDQFTAFGPTVNLASRLEGRAEDNEIIISENTKNKIEYKNKFKLKTIMIDPNHKIKAFEYIDRYYEVLN